MLKMYSMVANADTRQSLDVETYTPKGGYLWRSELPKVSLSDQFIWIARLKAHPGKRDDLVSAALVHANNVHRTEEETVTFVVLESNEDKDLIVLFERYTSEDYFEKVHKPSESMAEYREKASGISFELHGGIANATQ